MATAAAEPAFVDTNVLINSRLALAPFHAQALGRLAGLRAAGHDLWISRQTVREYLAAMSRPGALTGAIPMAALIADGRPFLTVYRVAEDGPAVTAELLTLLTTVAVGGKQVHDAKIVATMRAHGVTRLLTHNVADFTRFAAVVAVEPLVP